MYPGYAGVITGLCQLGEQCAQAQLFISAPSRIRPVRLPRTAEVQVLQEQKSAYSIRVRIV